MSLTRTDSLSSRWHVLKAIQIRATTNSCGAPLGAFQKFAEPRALIRTISFVCNDCATTNSKWWLKEAACQGQSYPLLESTYLPQAYQECVALGCGEAAYLKVLTVAGISLERTQITNLSPRPNICQMYAATFSNLVRLFFLALLVNIYRPKPTLRDPSHAAS